MPFATTHPLRLLAALAALTAPSSGGASPGPGGEGSVRGELVVWRRVDVSFSGPVASETDPWNPFRDYRLDVTFTHAASGRSYVVPGFFAADGDAADSGASAGRVWRAHFAPDESGLWTYRASFLTGRDVAVGAAGGLPFAFDGARGDFEVAPAGAAGAELPSSDLRARGALRHVGERYLVFVGTGERYLKHGTNSPENFLAYAGFDGTWDTGGLPTPGLTDGLHRYAGHAAQDFDPADPTDAAHTWAGGKGAGILGAVNYLASQGIDSIYALTYTIDGGDGGDTWPWIASAPGVPTGDERLRFDVSKLAQWERVFRHMNARGVAPHLALQEFENGPALGTGGLSLERRLYYREMVARFAHLPALTWTIGEESADTPADQLAFASHLRALDPYDHPIGLHCLTGQPAKSFDETSFFEPLYGHPSYELFETQTTFALANPEAVVETTNSAAAGKPAVLYATESWPPIEVDSTGSVWAAILTTYGNLLGGGGGVERFQGSDTVSEPFVGDLQCEDFSLFSKTFEVGRFAGEFFRERVRFWDMAPANELLSGVPAEVEEHVHCLAKPGVAYALFLISTELPVALDLGPRGEEYALTWFRVHGGTYHAGGVLQGGGPRLVGPAPTTPGAMWALLVENVHVRYTDEGASPAADGRIPAISPVGAASAPNPAFAITVGNVARATDVLLVLDLARSGPMPVPGGGALVASGPTSAQLLATADANGVAAFALPIPEGVSGPAGGVTSLFAQAVALDTAGQPNGVSELLELELH